MQETSSLAESLASLDEGQRAKILADLTEDQAKALEFDWSFWARPKQLPPEGDWLIWLILAGRGFGKTRIGAEWVRSIACGSTPLGRGQCNRIAIVAETAADARDVMVEGESGILSVHPPDFRPLYEPSKRRLTWPNGAIGSLYNATEPDQLRGPQHDAGWSDELAKWRYSRETWDMLQFGMRGGENPRQVITTTPRPIKVLREIMAMPSTVVTRGSTSENVSNLAASFLKKIMDRYEGTRLGRQELNAEILDDVPGALWSRDSLDTHRITEQNLPELERVVVGVDPSISSGEDANETGIVVAGTSTNRDGHTHGYILDDQSMRGSPEEWAKRAVSAYRLHQADRIVAEKNQGGEMVEAVIKAHDRNVPVKLVSATRGKYVRAEPMSALYEQGRVHHVGSFVTLEDQMVMFTPESAIDRSDGSPDRVDALVWALTALFDNIVARRKPSAPRPKTQNHRYNVHRRP